MPLLLFSPHLARVSLMVDLKVEELNWAEAQLFGGGVGLCCAACGILVL